MQDNQHTELARFDDIDDIFIRDSHFEKPLCWDCACDQQWSCACEGGRPYGGYSSLTAPVFQAYNILRCNDCGSDRPAERFRESKRHEWSDLNCPICSMERPWTPKSWAWEPWTPKLPLRSTDIGIVIFYVFAELLCLLSAFVVSGVAADSQVVSSFASHAKWRPLTLFRENDIYDFILMFIIIIVYISFVFLFLMRHYNWLIPKQLAYKQWVEQRLRQRRELQHERSRSIIR